jgi:hypothetical protein
MKLNNQAVEVLFLGSLFSSLYPAMFVFTPTCDKKRNITQGVNT